MYLIVFFQSLYENLPTLEEKIDLIIAEASKLIKYKAHSDEHYKLFCISMVQRVKALLNYETQFTKLKSTITLIKPKKATVSMDEEDFGLSEYTETPVEIIYVEGDHVVIVENEECAEEINRTLLPEQIVFKEMIAEKPDALKEEAVRS